MWTSIKTKLPDYGELVEVRRFRGDKERILIAMRMAVNVKITTGHVLRDTWFTRSGKIIKGVEYWREI